FLQRALQAGNAIRGSDHLVSVVFKIVAQARHHVGLVFQNQNLGHMLPSTALPIFNQNPKLRESGCPCQSRRYDQADAALLLLGSASTGSAMVNLLPWPGALSTDTSPP